MEKEIVGMVVGAQMLIDAGIGTGVELVNVVVGSKVVVGGPGTHIIGETGVRAGKPVTDVGIIGVGLGGRVGVRSWGVTTRYVGGGT
jgi:hypothetical protein